MVSPLGVRASASARLEKRQPLGQTSATGLASLTGTGVGGGVQALYFPGYLGHTLASFPAGSLPGPDLPTPVTPAGTLAAVPLPLPGALPARAVLPLSPLRTTTK